MSDTQVLERPEERTSEDDDRVAHLVDKAASTEGYVMGKPCVALCGKVWVPSRDPNSYPVCKKCIEIFEEFFGEGSFGKYFP